MNDKLSKVGDGSPWGTIDSVTPIADGLQWVGTPGHGGIELAAWRWADVRATFPRFTTWGTNGMRWFEEDCDFCAVVMTWPELFRPQLVRGAVQTADCGICANRGMGPHDVPAKARTIADEWAAENADNWQVLGGHSTRAGCWFREFRRVGDGARRSLELPSYPEKPLYTSAELDELASQAREKINAARDSMPPNAQRLPRALRPTSFAFADGCSEPG